MDKNKLEALLTIHPSSIGSSCSWCQSPQQAAISDAGKIENTEFFVGVITVNSTEQSRGLTRENCPDQSLISECVGWGDGEAMTGHIGPGERGEETHGHSVICIGVKMNGGAGVSVGL